MSDPPGPVVVAVDEQSDVAIDLDRWQALASGALRHEGVETGELNLLFVDEAEMRDLNARFMGDDRATDVLSFPLDGVDAGDDPGSGEPLIGDIVVCPAYAARQAPDHAGERGHRGCLTDELALLVVHGVLHVVGWDHADRAETEAMQDRERVLLGDLHRR